MRNRIKQEEANEGADNLSYQLLEDKYPEEIISGKVVLLARPAVTHNLVFGNIYGIFYQYLKGKRCTPFADGTDLYLTNSEHYIPDMMIVCDLEDVFDRLI